MRCYSLFSGIGGFDLAAQRNNIEMVGACEIDEYARQTYNKHFRGIEIKYDATKIIPGELPDFDLLTAGFPCQAFSIAGNRLGFQECRGTLFFEIARIAREKRPRYLLLENVKGLFSHDRGKTFANILATLDELGYDAEWQVFNSKYFVPQNRERVFIIGHSRKASKRQIFPLGELNGKAVEKKFDRQISTALDSNYWKGLDNHGQRTMVQMNQTPHDTGRIYDPNGLARTLRANSGGMGSKTGLYAISSSGRSWGREGRVKIDEANTLSCGSGCASQSSQNVVDIYERKKDSLGRNRQLHHTQKLRGIDHEGHSVGIRRLTPLECERLQGFPDKWTEGVSDTQRYRQLGNAITVPVVEYILKRLVV